VLHERVKKAWDALCRDPRQDDKSKVMIVLGTKYFRSLLKSRDDQLWLEYAEGLKFRVYKDDALSNNVIKVVVGNLYIMLPREPNNIDRLREATGQWQIHGWWKEKDPWSQMMKPR
jgi:hypothetical protein